MNQLSIAIHRLTIYWLIAASLLAAAAFGQNPTMSGATNEVMLTVAGEVSRPLKLTGEVFAKLPRRSVKATEHDGTSATFEGVSIYEILQLAGVEFGDKLRGKRLASYLVVEAEDGYRVIFALPELDPAYTDKLVLLADRRDGQPLSGKEGKLRVIVTDEKRQTRWARQVISLTIRSS